MELANNTWNKGLLMDTHPMMLGNDSMTDCLNGTLITMNGNEVILQNDMGNRRIDHAFLPSGYEPVGIKEHGGVIYVASYNPITNKSLIGSFPSPERVIDINDDNLKNNFDFDSFFKEKTSEGGNIQNDSTLKIPVMISDSFLIPLTPKNKLHVGDIFTVYSPHLSSLASDLTNYDNIILYSEWEECTKQEYDEITDSNLKKEKIIELQSTYYKRSLIDKVYSPKNRKYTLLLGILNEQNNFNDITSSLVRWNSPLKEVTEKEYNEYKTTKEIRYYVYEDNVWKEVTEEYYNSFKGTKQRKYFIYVPQIIRNLENKSQLYKFNTGYFIPDGFLSDKDIDGETIDDANLIKSRKQIAANNFSYKLAGPLYLKVSYNHVHSFGYAINGTWDGKKATLKITGYFTYNCPDGVNTINDNGDSDYYTFKTGEPTNIQFDFFDNNENTPNKPAKIEPDLNTTSTSTCIYNKTTNLYTVTLVKEYTITPNSGSDIYNYVIGVLGGNYKVKVHQDLEDEESELIEVDKPFYIKDLSSIGQINLRLLNSGAITLKLYKFYNKAETHDTTMTLEFETYPKEGLTFEDMYLEFDNILNDDEHKYEPKRYLALHLPILNGKLVFSFNWLDSISNDAKGTEYDENVPYEEANIKLKARQTYKVTIHYKDNDTLLILEINTNLDLLGEQKTLLEEQLSSATDPAIIEQLQLEINLKQGEINALQDLLEDLDSSTYDDGIDRWLLTTELFNDLYSSNLTDYCNKALTYGNLLFLEKLTVAPKYIESLFNVSYGEVTYYDPREDNHNQAPMYRATLLENDSLTLYLYVYFKKKPDYQEMDSTIYPEYLGEELHVTVDAEDEEILNSETITKTSYEPLSHVYFPMRTLLELLNRSDLMILFHTDSDVSDDINHIYIRAKKQTNILFPGYNESTLSRDKTPLDESYNIDLYYDAQRDAPVTITINSIGNPLDKITDIETYSKLMLKSFFSFNWGDDNPRGFYRLGDSYGVLSPTNRLIFIKRSIIDNNSALINSVLNWNELEASDNIYKIIGATPLVKELNITFNYTISLESNLNTDLPTIGNLIFSIDTDDHDIELNCLYNNIDIVNSYNLYKRKVNDSNIVISSGNKILNTKLELNISDFKILNYNTIFYNGPYESDVWLSRAECYISSDLDDMAHIDGNRVH